MSAWIAYETYNPAIANHWDDFGRPFPSMLFEVLPNWCETGRAHPHSAIDLRHHVIDRRKGCLPSEARDTPLV